MKKRYIDYYFSYLNFLYQIRQIGDTVKPKAKITLTTMHVYSHVARLVLEGVWKCVL